MFYCFLCGSKLKWQSDFTFEEYGCIGDGIIGVYTCSNSEKCGADYELKTYVDNSTDHELNMYNSEDIYSSNIQHSYI